MEEKRNYNFEILFEKIEEAKKENSYLPLIDNQLIKEVDRDIESLRGYIEAINESEYPTYSRS
jgi:hypothetical protein